MTKRLYGGDIMITDGRAIRLLSTDGTSTGMSRPRKTGNFTTPISKDIVRSDAHVDDVKYSIKKLDFLCELKKDLIRNNLLIYNDNFKKYISNKKVILYDIPRALYCLIKLISIFLASFSFSPVYNII